MRANGFITVLVLLLSSLYQTWNLTAGGVTGRGGFDAVTATADGKLLAVAGQNRVVYLLSGETLEVQKRIWIGTRIGNLAFSKDGSRLLIEDETDTIHQLDVRSAKILSKLTSHSSLLPSPDGELVVLRDDTDLTMPRLRWLSSNKLEEKGRLDLESRLSAYRFDPSGKWLIVFSSSKIGPEKRVPINEVPRELTGLARWTFRLKYDGLVADLSTIDLSIAKLSDSTSLWYTSDSDSTVLIPGKTTYILNRSNLNAKITSERTELFETSERLNHAIGVSPDCKTLVLGGIGSGSHGPIEGKRTRFELEPLSGQSEMFTRFFVRNDGTTLAVTSAYRVVQISRNGKIEKVAPVY